MIAGTFFAIAVLLLIGAWSFFLANLVWKNIPEELHHGAFVGMLGFCFMEGIAKLGNALIAYFTSGCLT